MPCSRGSERRVRGLLGACQGARRGVSGGSEVTEEEEDMMGLFILHGACGRRRVGNGHGGGDGWAMGMGEMGGRWAPGKGF